MSDQLGIPVDVPISELSRKKTLGASIELCAELAGYAWFQFFGNGSQYYGDASDRGRARAVRRISIR